MKTPSLSELLESDHFPKVDKEKYDDEIAALQLKMLRAQQGIYHAKRRVILAFEGFDAAGKGGTISRIMAPLDPRGVKVVAIGPPDPVDQAKHWLYRFWKELPAPGVITVFDRTWYGRVLVERVDHLTEKKDWKRGYDEINEFERMLIDDGVTLIKIFLAISKKEQLSRFEARLNDPYKLWKITPDDVRARSKWHKYVKATDDLFERTHTKHSPWHLIPANDKDHARVTCLETIVSQLAPHVDWMEKQVEKREKRSLNEALKALGSGPRIPNSIKNGRLDPREKG